MALYLGMFFYLYLAGGIAITTGGYVAELLSENVTIIGQATKLLILFGFVVLMAYLAGYTRRLFDKLVVQEVNLRVEKESIERELEIAAHVQQNLLPQTFPQMPGVEIYGTLLQGRFVGGDYYDFLRLSETTLLFVIADVSGKGVPAALIMSEVRASTHLLASMQLTLEELAQRLNTLLFESTARKYFVSFFAAEIDTAHGLMRYVNAGHPPPLVYAGGRVTALAKGGVPLGIRAALPQLAQLSEPLPHGSMIVAFTDGIGERANTQGEQYGEERLAKFIASHAALQPQSFVQQLLVEVKKFGQSRDLDDDVAIAVTKFLPKEV